MAEPNTNITNGEVGWQGYHVPEDRRFGGHMRVPANEQADRTDGPEPPMLTQDDGKARVLAAVRRQRTTP